MIKYIKNHVVKYLSEIGRKEGLKSRRKLSSTADYRKVMIREARRAFRKYYHQCFWSCDPDYKVEQKDLKWIGLQLQKNGDRELWKLGLKLCR